MSRDSRSEREQQVSAVLLVAFAALLLTMVILEAILISSRPTVQTVHADFVQKASLSFVMPLFLLYLVIGGLGLVGTLGLVRVYGTSGLARDAVQFAAAGYFVIGYWLWAATWIVQHRITRLAVIPTSPPDWLLQIYDASDSLWAFGGWGSLGPGIILFAGLALMLTRSSRVLPRSAGILFGVLAVSQFLGLAYFGVRGFGGDGGFDFPFLNDLVFTAGRIVAYLLAAAALYTEKGIFVRSTRT